MEKRLKATKSREIPTDRTQWLAVLDTASHSQPDHVNDDWLWLMDQLRIPYEYFPAVLLAIQQGRWRNAKNPRNYIKVVSRREAKKNNLLPVEDKILTLIDSPKNGKAYSFDDALANICHYASSEATKREGGVWKRGSGWSDDRYFDEDDPRNGTYRDFLLSHVPVGLKHIEPPSEEDKKEIEEINKWLKDDHIHPVSSTSVDWERWGEMAGLDRWETRVLTYKLSNVSRERALSEQTTEENRKALQAAWKRFDRGGPNRLREAAKKIIS